MKKTRLIKEMSSWFARPRPHTQAAATQ